MSTEAEKEIKLELTHVLFADTIGFSKLFVKATPLHECKAPFLEELKRRNVIRAAILYIGASCALAQGISQLGPSVGAPEWGTR